MVCDISVSLINNQLHSGGLPASNKLGIWTNTFYVSYFWFWSSLMAPYNLSTHEFHRSHFRCGPRCRSRIDSGEKVFARVGTPAFWAPEVGTVKVRGKTAGGSLNGVDFWFCVCPVKYNSITNICYNWFFHWKLREGFDFYSKKFLRGMMKSM